MLQALKLDSASCPAAPREREPGADLQDSAFAGYLASAASFVNLKSPTAAPAPRPASREALGGARTEPRRASPHPESAPERPAPRETPARAERARTDDRGEAARTDQAKTGDRVEAARAERMKADDRAQEAGTKASDRAQKPEEAGENQEAPANPKEPGTEAESLKGQAAPAGPAPLAPASLVSALASATQAATPAGEVPARPASSPAQAPGAPGLQMISQGTTGPMQIASSKAQTALEQASPGVHLRLQVSEGAPATVTSKPALSEFLSLPKPEMETPKPLLNAGRTEGTPRKDPPAAPLQTPPKAAEPPAPALPSGPATTGLEAALAVSTKAEILPGKASTTSGAPLAAAESGTPVKGTTPVPALGSPQGAKSNATFAQMDGTIRWLIKNQEKGAEIQMNPESLGRVVIKLRMEGSEVHAQLWASEATTVPILQDQRAALEASLRQQGLSLGSFDLQQGRRGDDAPPASHANPSETGAGIAVSLEKQQDLPTVPPALLGGAHLLEIFA